MNALKEHLNDRLSIYVLLMVLSGLMFYYNLVYVPTNEQKINEHALRIMENKARILKEKYTAYQTAINSAPSSYLLYWYFYINPDAKKLYVLKNNYKFYFSDSVTLLPPIKGADTTSFSSRDYSTNRIDPSLIPRIHGPQTQGSDKDIWKVKGGDFYFVYYPDVIFLKGKTIKKKTIQDTTYQYFWLKIKDFTSNIKANDFYEDIFVIRDANDKSRYDQKKLEVGGLDSQVLDDSKLNLVRMSLPDNASKLGSGIYDEKILGHDYKVYYKLVKLKQGLNVYVVGLVSTASLQKYARQIPTWFLVFCSLGVLILILLFPVLKIFFLNEHERLSAMDARLSVFSVVMCASLLVIILSGSYLFWVPELRNNEETMKVLSDSIRSKFTEEVKGLKKAVSDDSLFTSKNEKENALKFKNNNKRVNFNEALVLTKSGYILNILFSDTSKRNNLKKLPIRLADRNYYKFISSVEENGTSLDFHIEAINSLTSGKGEVAIVVPLTTKTYDTKIKPGPHELGGVMRVITSTLHSIINPQIPTPYKFSVVDRVGDVKFNSASKEISYENFINECNQDKVLSAYFENEIEGLVDFNYLHTDCSGYVQPLLKGWSLIVYYELGNSRSFGAQVFSMCLITLVLVAIYILILQIILATDNKRPIFLKPRAFFYDWLNPNNNKPSLWISLAFVNAFLFVLELLWLFINESIVLSSIFIFLIITAAYYLAYVKLSCFRKNYSPIESDKWLMGLMVIWGLTFIGISLFYNCGWCAIILIPLVAIYLIALKLNTWQLLVRFKNYITKKVQRKYQAYHFFLLSCLFVLAIGPSVIFIADHYSYQNFIRNYSYLLEDVKQIQEKLTADKKSYRGVDYTEEPAPEEKYNPVSREYLDSYFYAAIPRYSMRDASITGNRFNNIPNYTQDSIFTNEEAVFVKAYTPHSSDSSKNAITPKWSDYKNDIVRKRTLQAPLFIKDFGTYTIGLFTVAALLAFILIMKEISGKIFFMPVSNFQYPDQYPRRDASKNEIEREFENDDLDKHPLSGFAKKEEIINEYKNISALTDGYQKRLDTEVLLLKLQQAAESRYKNKWDPLPDPEKFLLYDLADDGVTNQTETSLFNKLSQEGLLRLNPKLELVNTSFANYVKSIMTKEQIAEWRKNEDKNGRWNNLRIALIIIIIAAFGFLSVAEEDFLGRVSALLASVAVAVPNLISAIGQISKLFKS